MIVTDVQLSRRLELTEALANQAFVNARAALYPGVGACWLQVADGYALFDGVGSPLTQAFGLGLSQTLTESDLAHIEDFFDARGADTVIELSPLADPMLLSWLSARGHIPVEHTSVMYRAVDPLDTGRPTGSVEVRRVELAELTEWASLSAEGWSASAELSAFVRDMALVTAHANGTHCFVAETDGTMIATAALVLQSDVALLAGASTLPAHRGRGAQTALLAARLRFAREAGIALAMMGAAPGSTSQANAERQGFRIAYTRTKWRRPARAEGAA
jgi:GNAT superfamily N-acetyltransferase